MVVVSAPLPDLDLEVRSVLTVDTGDPFALVTALVIHVAQDTPDEVLKQLTVAPAFAYGPEA